MTATVFPPETATIMSSTATATLKRRQTGTTSPTPSTASSASLSSSSPCVVVNNYVNSYGHNHYRQEQNDVDTYAAGKSKETDGIENSEDADANKARDRHDIFNLFALLPIILWTPLNYDWNMLLSGASPARAWTGDYLVSFIVVSATYFLSDFIWIGVTPHCVKSPGALMTHHVAALLYLIGPFVVPEFAWCMGVLLTVELNSWFLIARRVFHRRRGTIFMDAVLELVSFLFYASWIIIRVILYSYILWAYLSRYLQEYEATGTFLHFQAVFIAPHAAICLLNYKWTFDLLFKRPKKASTLTGDKEVAGAKDGRKAFIEGL